MREAEHGYYTENDSLGQVIEEHCNVQPGVHVQASEFNALARGKGCARGLKGAMQKRGYKQKTVHVDGKALLAYIGLTLKD